MVQVSTIGRDLAVPGCPGYSRAVRALAVFLVVGAAGVAHAGEDELQLTLIPAYAVVDFDARTPSGGGVAAELGYGLADAWTLRGSLALSAHPVDEDKQRKLPAGTLSVLGAFAGVRYAFDLLRTVPY